jgi:hypothetical protein
MAEQPPQNLQDIVDLLEKDIGWAYVNKNNVNELLTIASMRMNKKLEQQLRDWH